MTESLAELLRRSADAVTEPRVDVAELLAQAGKRQRRRRLAVAGGTAALVGAGEVGSLALRDGYGGDVEPAPSPSPSPPSSVAVDPTGTRPLVYAEGSTVHVGDSTFDAGGTVTFVDATDNGVVFMTGCVWPRPACAEDRDSEWRSDTLWYNDGSVTVPIGRAPTEHIGLYEVYTQNPGSLVAWADATSRTKGVIRRLAVYDTSRRQVVGTIPFADVAHTVLHVGGTNVAFHPDTPGCWLVELPSCSRRFVADVPARDNRVVFRKVGRRLVIGFDNGDPGTFRTTSGEDVALRAPAGWSVPGGEEELIVPVQWLDDDTVILFANVGGGDSPAQVGDLLECRLPDGECQVAVSSSSAPYRAPG
jgi:hypothetical protein